MEKRARTCVKQTKITQITLTTVDERTPEFFSNKSSRNLSGYINARECECEKMRVCVSVRERECV
jgi:hypothetical protein